MKAIAIASTVASVACALGVIYAIGRDRQPVTIVMRVEDWTGALAEIQDLPEVDG